MEESIISVDLRDVIKRFNETVEDEGDDEMPPEIRTQLQKEVLILEGKWPIKI